MPVVITSIARVTKRPVKVKGHWVDKYDVDPGQHQNAYETFSAWRASLCERASQTGQRVILGLRDGRCGVLEIVSAELEGMETVQ